MASLANDPGGTRRVLVMIDGRRKTIRLGKLPKKQAESIVRHVEALAASRIDGSAPPSATAAWLAGVSGTLRDRLVKTGLAQELETVSAATVAEVVQRFGDQKYANLKPNTVQNYKQAFRAFSQHAGTTTPVDRLTVGDAEAFRDGLLASGLAEATVRRRCADACALMGFAVKHRLIDRNPFIDAGRAIPRTIPATRRTCEISRETFEEVMKHVYDPELRLAYALSRYGGLRTPSESWQLTWGDIDWDRDRITVRSPKTERHEGRDHRLIPLFPELAPLLEEAFDQAEEGSVYVLPNLRLRSRCNARVNLANAIKRAGLEPWPRLMHNMRVARQTELEADFPTHVVCAWLGNTPRVANNSYLKVRECDFERAAKAAHYPAQKAPANGRTAPQPEKSDS